MLFGIGAGFSGMWNAEKAADELGMEVAPALLVTHYYDVWFVINICNLSATFSHLLAICTCISALFSPVCECVCVCVEGGLGRGWHLFGPFVMEIPTVACSTFFCTLCAVELHT